MEPCGRSSERPSRRSCRRSCCYGFSFSCSCRYGCLPRPGSFGVRSALGAVVALLCSAVLLPADATCAFVPLAPTTNAVSAEARVRCHSTSNEPAFGSVLPASPRNADEGSAEATATADNRSNDRRKRQRLSRPERKAQERLKKQQRRRSDKKSNVGSVGSRRQSPTVPRLLLNVTTSDDVHRTIKRAQERRDRKDLNSIADFLLNDTDESYAYGYRGTLLSRLAVAALHMNAHSIARKAIETRRLYHRPGMLPMASAAILRGLLRNGNVTQALEVLDDELALPMDGTNLLDEHNRELVKHRALSLGSIASRYFFENEPVRAIWACKAMARMGPIVRQAGLNSDNLDMPWLRIITGAAKCESARRAGTVQQDPEAAKRLGVTFPCNLVYAVMDAMATFPSDNNDQVYEAVSNALVRRVLFVTGAVDMKGCPKADRGEAVFIGRSNVGKSSLVNMVTNRKSLAYTSKRPGKTQQFNYFAVNDKPGREKEIKYGDVVEREKDLDSFYIVDLPGFGFAKVPEHQRNQWAAFMTEYLSTRRTLRVVFHLVDARHGLIDEDATIMEKVGANLPKNVAYVVVLTKADKNVKKSSRNKPGKVSPDILSSVRATMRQCKVGNSPVILTSAETKLGRDDIWRFLRLAAEA